VSFPFNKSRFFFFFLRRLSASRAMAQKSLVNLLMNLEKHSITKSRALETRGVLRANAAADIRIPIN
jgi:hypothetical protein